MDTFWDQVTKSDGCWTFAAHLSGHGYRSFRGRPAHRVAWELSNGPIPDGMNVLHKCDNPPCVRPTHLFLGTHADNMRDAKEKGRMKAPTLLTVSEAATVLGLAASTLRHQVRLGKLQAAKVGRDLFLTSEEVDRYAAENRKKTPGMAS